MNKNDTKIEVLDGLKSNGVNLLQQPLKKKTIVELQRALKKAHK